MKKVLLAGALSALMMFCAPTSHAQDNSPLRRHEIGFGAPVRTNGFQPAFTYKLNLGPEGRSALRTRFRFERSSTDSEVPFEACQRYGFNESQSSAYFLDLGYERRVPFGKFMFYYGGDVNVGMSNSSSLQEAGWENCLDSTSTYVLRESSSDSWQAGIQPFIGLRWVPVSRIALSLEFSAPLTYTVTNSENSTLQEYQIVNEPTVVETLDQNYTWSTLRFGPGMALFFNAAIRL